MVDGSRRGIDFGSLGVDPSGQLPKWDSPKIEDRHIRKPEDTEAIVVKDTEGRVLLTMGIGHITSDRDGSSYDWEAVLGDINAQLALSGQNNFRAERVETTWGTLDQLVDTSLSATNLDQITGGKGLLDYEIAE